jgi:hypothetical protein
VSPVASSALRVDPDYSDADVTPPSVTEGEPRRRPLRVGIINNPASGQNARRGLLTHVRALLGTHPQVDNFEEDTLDGMMAAVHDLMQRETEIIAVNGGDGTVQAVLTGMLRAPAERLPLLAVLHGGTTNSTARNVGYGGRPLAALQRLLAASARGAVAGTVERRPVVRVAGDGEPQYAMMFGAGAVYHGIHFARTQIESRGVRGNTGAGVAVATFLAKVISGNGGELFPPLHATVRLDGQDVPTERYLGILTATIDRHVLGISPYWGTGPGRLRYSSMAYQPRNILRAAVPAVRGRSSAYLQPHLGYRSVNVEDVELSFDSGFTLDGELFAPAGRAHTNVRLSGRQCAYFLRDPA